MSKDIVQGDCCDHPQLGFPYIKQCDSKYLKWSRTCFLHNLLLFGLHGSAAVCMMAWWCGVFVLSNWCIQKYSRRQTATNKAQDSFPLSITLFLHSFLLSHTFLIRLLCSQFDCVCIIFINHRIPQDFRSQRGSGGEEEWPLKSIQYKSVSRWLHMSADQNFPKLSTRTTCWRDGWT